MTTEKGFDPWRPPKILETPPDVITDSPVKASASTITWPLRIWLVLGGIVTPLICHGLSTLGLPERPLWQTGNLKDKLVYVLSPEAGFILYPMMVFAMVCMVMYLNRQSRERPSFWIRVGIWSGLPIAIFYSAILAITLNSGQFSLGRTILVFAAQSGLTAVPLLAIWLASLVFRLRNHRAIITTGIVTLVVGLAVVGGFVVGEPHRLFGVFFAAPLLLVLFTGPVWTLYAFGYLCFHSVVNRPEDASVSPFHRIASAIYGLSIPVACRFAIAFSHDRYAQLPTTPVSQCYVVTAASRGHDWFVRPKQLRVLKAFETALSQKHPEAHRRLRCFYDAVGPWLARRCCNPWTADAAYLTLKPIEWTALLTLALWSYKDGDMD